MTDLSNDEQVLFELYKTALAGLMSNASHAGNMDGWFVERARTLAQMSFRILTGRSFVPSRYFRNVE